MDFFITFFRDILDGPVYMVVAIICGILFCSFIGYLAEVHFNKKKQALEYQSTHANVSMNTPSNAGGVTMQQNIQQNMQGASQNYGNSPSNFPNNQGINTTGSNNVGNVNGNQ